jgi:DNA replication licensing factor MCM5
VLTVDLADLKAHAESMYERMINFPLDMIKVMEDTVRQYVRLQEFRGGDQEWQVAVRSDEFPRRLREINSGLISKLFTISGIIITSTKPYIKASKLHLQCRNCLATRIIELAPGQNPYVPIFCSGQTGVNQKCPSDPFVAMPDSQVIDTQTLKIQENPEDVPTGEIARTYTLVVDRTHVSRCVPGDRVQITGVMMVHDIKGDNLSKGYIYVTDIRKLKERTSFHYSEHEEEVFKDLAKDPKIRDKIYQSIAPGIFGNEDIKKAIACMLFGGSRKHLPDKTLLRGDINILLIGDPSTAKSQFLKFVEQTASIAVYTSGKGSSAAGLTASITKDSMTGEFQIEGGALVLADGGIVCID